MSRFVNTATGVVFSVDDGKDDRYTSGGYEPVKAEPKKAPAKAPSK